MRFPVRLATLTAIVLSTSLPAQEDPGTSHRLRVVGKISTALRMTLESNFDTLEQPFGRIDIIVMPEELAEVKRLKLRTKLIARGRPFADIVKTTSQAAPDTKYYTPAEILKEIDRLAAKYPKIAKRVDLSALSGASKTIEKRSIYALKISDKVGDDEDEPAILVAAAHHARELNSPVMVFGAIENVLSGYAKDTALKALVDGYELFFVPCVNPDGSNHVWTKDNMWRKNRRPNGGKVYGVDNNRNYPFLFGKCGSSTKTSSGSYRGPSAGSEPENKTLMAFSRVYRPEIYLDFHSSGREVLDTYAPCATVGAKIKTFLARYRDSLRTPMKYATRKPSASGEAPEYFWSQGAMSFLTEVMSSFQPTYASAVTEAARVWPGVKQAMTSWRPALRGHVKSVYMQQPVETTITYTPNLFSHGEVSGSRARDGRFAVWLPLGTFTVKFQAKGFATVTRKVVVKSYDKPQSLEILMLPVENNPATLTKSGSDKIGTTTSLTYTSKDDAGDLFWVLISGGSTPGIDIGAGRIVPLNADSLLFASLQPVGVLANHFGTLPISGQAVAKLSIPAIPSLVGFKLVACGVTTHVDWLGSVKRFTSALPITIK